MNFCVLSTLFIALFLFFFNDTATTEIYTLSLHDALPISIGLLGAGGQMLLFRALTSGPPYLIFPIDRKSTRLNSSHSQISYAVFCLKKKNSTSVDSSPSLASTWSTSRPSYVTASC